MRLEKAYLSFKGSHIAWNSPAVSLWCKLFLWVGVLYLAGCQGSGDIEVISTGQPIDMQKNVTEDTNESPASINQQSINLEGVEIVNPFLTQAEREALGVEAELEPLEGVSLSAIIYSSRSRQAIVDGRIVREGDIVTDKRIVEIRPDALILEDARSRYILDLPPVGGVNTIASGNRDSDRRSSSRQTNPDDVQSDSSDDSSTQNDEEGSNDN